MIRLLLVALLALAITDAHAQTGCPAGVTIACFATLNDGPVAPGTAAGKSLLTGGVYNSSLPTLTSGQQAAMQIDSSGRLFVNIGSSTLTLGGALPTGANTIGGVTQSGTWNIGAITTLPALATGVNVIGGVTRSGAWNIGTITTLPALPTGSNTIGAVTQASGPWAENITQIAGVAIATGNGTAAGSIRVSLPTDGTGVVGLNAGTNVVGKMGIDQSTPGTTNAVATSPGARTLVALDVATVTTGGTAVTALAAGNRTAGGWFQNPKGATIDLCINEIGTASGTTSAGSTTCIVPGQIYLVAPAAGAVSVISSDSAHPFSGMGWK